MADSSEPKKEPARITVPSDPLANPAVQMRKTQLLTNLPAVEMPAANMGTVSPEPQRRIDAIPMLFCWALLAASAAILILQIWNYLA
jgi:hypothetical protein